MSVTAPLGFTAAGVTAGLKPSGKKDLALVVNGGPSTAVAAVYTSNRCRANPVIWSEQVSATGHARAVVLNSGGANCYTGDYGFATTQLTAEETATLLTDAGIPTQADEILICSTGLIGVGGEEFRAGILDHLPELVADASDSVESGENAAEAIMTTDTVAKTATREGDGYTIGGMAKGAGMLAPGLATMLVVITTDAPLDQPVLDAALRKATHSTFDRLDTDGCMSTNDTVILMSSGAADTSVDTTEFERLLGELCHDLMRQLHVDAEGAHHDIAITTQGAATEADAVTVSRSVARSNLFKAAIFGEDPNWGRVVAQVGTTSADFDPTTIDVTINGTEVCRSSGPYADPAEVVFGRQVDVVIDLHAGDATATIWTSDLSHDYVEENSAYST
ncbi:bifunctional glutamate N-acetyltransferase/amino-acid acetyltransferase ArgJ [Brevibacterium casei]|uniref:bifunctional glutamate N-acetyltransferase/amino-acid acetyltransferase ArgJ n=1 Tax=Brevibacterium casei TaxID=33889 RepID=UPI00186B92B6|nr:bifunctional glutamate N-acetyltransferase/amino-acid acetyltransferase ArgJ [Brevibacterium casei]MBE4696245.1 bifunctional glutamate N-acetyltransferase/amino-acid acetyltransferase ArgJ [Brevibacterium casei]MBY3579367.1 bifunctional glutamate N-acetyltransferase/amino-acid acetyltransferase ArgJ [Brevibacterium casei]